MVKKVLLLASLFFVWSNNIVVAQADSTLFERAVDYVIQQRIEQLKAKNRDSSAIYGSFSLDNFQLDSLDNKYCGRGYFINYPAGINLSCFKGYYKTTWISDFDGDGEQDVVIQITDEGLGLGISSNYGIDYCVVLMKNRQPSAIHSILGGGYQSFGSLYISNVNDGRIYTILRQNSSEEINWGGKYWNLPKQPKIFEYSKERATMMEVGYPACLVANLKSPLFKEKNNSTQEEQQILNDQYENEWQVTYTTLNRVCFLQVAGCQIFEIYYTNKIIQKDKKLRSWGAKQAAALILQEIDFLRKNTTFASETWEEVDQEVTHHLSDSTKNKNRNYSLKLSLNKDRVASFFISEVGSLILEIKSVNNATDATQYRGSWEWNRYARKR